MVAYRGTPDDYAEGRRTAPPGWGWGDVLPFFRKLEHEMDFDGGESRQGRPVPIRRTPMEDWAPLSKAVHAYAQRPIRSSPT